MEINKKLTLLNHGIKTTDSETFLELKSAKKSMENMEENITDQMETLKSKLTGQFSKLEEKIESYEDSIDVFNNDMDSLRGDLSEQFSNFQSGIIEQFTEASIRYNEFMIPKIWVSLASLKDGDRGSDGLNLGLYREDGTERQKPVYKQVDGFYRLLWTADSRSVSNVPYSCIIFTIYSSGGSWSLWTRARRRRWWCPPTPGCLTSAARSGRRPHTRSTWSMRLEKCC